ncbi:MAG: hypothetical protein ACRCXT_11955 [Paraclostridium sp.]
MISKTTQRQMIKWVQVKTRAGYEALEVKNANHLYFIEETGEIFKGEKSFTESIIMVDTLPVKGALGKVYVKNSDLSGWVFKPKAAGGEEPAPEVVRTAAGEWLPLIKPVVESLVIGEDQTGVASAEAVKAFVVDQFTKQVTGKFVEGISYDKATKDLKFTKNGEEHAVAIDGFVAGASYDGATGVLSFAVEGGEAININLPKDNFVNNGYYDEATQEIVLELTQGGEVRIPAIDLVDIYRFGSTSSIQMTHNLETNDVSAAVRISTKAGNALSVVEDGSDDGLFVEHTDISGKIDKLEGSKAFNLVAATGDGGITDAGHRVGTSVIIEAEGDDTYFKNETILATEAAVLKIRDILKTGIDEKINKANIVTTVATSIDDTSDDKVLSEKAVVGALLKLDADKINKTNIAVAVDANRASAEHVVSEKALVDSNSWEVIE